MAALGLTTGLLAAAPAAWSAGQADLDATIAAADAAHTKDTPPAAGRPLSEDETSRAIAKALQSSVEVPIPSLDTEYTETVATPAGKLSETQHPKQQRMKRGDTWVALDSSLVAGPGGSLVPKATPSELVLSGGGNGPLATMRSKDGKRLAVSTPFALPKPAVTANSALYTEVLNGVDLKVTASEQGGFTTVLVVKNADAAANPALKNLKFATSADGVTVTADEGGNLEAKDASGTTVFHAPAPLIWDSSSQQAPAAAPRALKAAPAPKSTPTAPATSMATSNADGPGTGAKVATMPVKATGSAVELTADQTVLAGPDTKYPVYIDPSWIPATMDRQSWTWIQQGFPGTSNFNKAGSSGADRPGVGYQGWSSPYGIERTYYQFNVSAYKGAIVNKATLKVDEYSTSDWSCSNKYGVNAYLSAEFDGNTTWNNPPARYDFLGTAQVGGARQSGCSGSVAVTWDATTIVKNGIAAGWNVAAFTIQGNESDRNAFKRFDYNGAALSIEYDRVPNVPTNPHVGPASPHTVVPGGSSDACDNSGLDSWGWVNSADASLNMTVTSPVQGQLAGWYHIWDYAQSGVPEIASGYTGMVNSGANAPFQLPAGALKDGHHYGWGAFATDTLPGVGMTQFSPDCHFKVDLTAPNVSFPATVSDPSKQFPAAGNGQTPQIALGQSGTVPVTATDPNPSGGLTSGLACLRWSYDPQLTNAAWQCGGTMPTAGIQVTPGNWGTQILYVQAQDNAGNNSQVSPYAFYVPWNASGPAPVFGDVTGDGAPDVLSPDSNGNLRAYTVPGNPVAKSPATSLAAKVTDSPDKDSWANYRTTHRGTFSGGKNVDDLLAHKDSSPKLYLYPNPGNTNVQGRFDNKAELAKPGCATGSAECTGYATTWSTTRQIAAVGDPVATDLDPGKQFRNKSGLLTVESGADGDAGLWYYPTIGTNQLGTPVRLAATGWKNRELLSPGDWAGQGHPGLWTRDAATGVLLGFTFTTGTGSIPDEFGDPVQYPTLTAISAPTDIGGTLTTKLWPRVGSDGDLTGNGNPTLWGITEAGEIQIWTGKRAGTPTAPKYSWQTGPDTVLTTAQVPNQWLLNSTARGTDSGGTNPATLVGNAAWTTDHKGTANSAANLNGAYYKTASPSVDTSRSYSVSAWVKLDNTDGYQTFVTQNGKERGSYYLQYSKAFNAFAFVTPDSDNYWTGTYHHANGATPPQLGVWTHLVATFNAGTGSMTLYVNGKYAGADTNPTPWNATGPITIGADAAANYPVGNLTAGATSDVRTYPYPLTSEQVTALYNN
ncbi:LamG-like jellyroll fold domain-containing protein [Kitasatospora sp. NPDC101801]|uniref:LamG-like jellyroll fold domain-containing protein n=1 Tax=Kitasatospora sp. NPDC101801 TaxID=3364103 RepID=UPI003802FF27